MTLSQRSNIGLARFWAAILGVLAVGMVTLAHFSAHSQHRTAPSRSTASAAGRAASR